MCTENLETRDGKNMKLGRTAALCSALALIASASAARVTSAATSASEVKTLAAHIHGGKTLALAGGDVNGDGIINAADLAIKKRMIFSQESALPLLINEICSSNSSVLADKDGKYSDWIEIYNYSKTESINLAGIGLSDNPDKPFKYVLPDVTVEPGGYLVVFASDAVTTEGELHTGFALSADGETVLLTHPTLGMIDLVEFPALSADITYGRYANGSATFTVLTPTAGKSNDLGSVVDNLAAPEAPAFSKQSGFYDSEFTLSLSSTGNTKIYYTTDGSDPTTSSTRYSAPLSVKSREGEANVYSMTPDTSVYSTYTPSKPIDKATIIRAVAVDDKGNTSAITSATYFIGKDYAEKYKDFAVISVITDPDNLYDYDTGIYVKGKVYDDNKSSVDDPWGGMWGGWGGMADDGSTQANYNQRGKEWERAAHIDFFDNSHNLLLSQDCGIRTQGGWTRAYLQKSLRFIARKEYGAGKFSAALIPGLVKENDRETPLEKFDTFIMRNGGNSCDLLKFKCAYIQKLVEDRHFDTQGANPLVAYMDGEYWGLYMVREDYDDHYINNNYDIPADDAIIVKVGELDEGDEQTDQALYDELISFAKNNDMTVDANYKKMCEMIDVQSLIDYYATEIFIDNNDWPTNNYRLWRSRTVDASNPYQDGKWRWMLYDVEMSMDLYQYGRNYSSNTLSEVMGKSGGFGASNGDHTAVFTALIKNAEFKELFTNTLLDIVYVNFDYEKATELMDYYMDLYLPLVDDQYARFGPKLETTPAQYYQKQADGVLSFLKNRPTYVPQMLKSALGLGNSYQITLSASGSGTVKINTASPDLSSGSWTGTYFEDYPVTLTAVPESGKTFKGWSGDVDSTEKTITVTLSQAMNIQASFS